MQDILFRRLNEIYEELVEFRRDLHRYPELSHQEVNTPVKIANYLDKLGMDVERGIGGNGIVARLTGGKPGKTVALRADFDALPIQDQKEVSYKSRIPGVMHACGHDIHTSALLGVAKVLSEQRNQLCGNVVFIFQFGEELFPGGAEPMIKAGCLDGVDVIYGAHVWSTIPAGTVWVKEGSAMAAADKFEIKIIGRGGHGATPHLTVDPIVVASQLVVNMQQIISRRIDPLESGVISIGSIHGGEAHNVIPSEVEIVGTTRSFNQGIRELLESSIRQVVHSTCEMAGATYELSYTKGYPAVNNDPIETRRLEAAARKALGEDKVGTMPPIMAGEDFAYYLEKLPGTFFFFGGSNPDHIPVYPHHHPHFDVDESAMLTAGKVFITAVLDYNE